MFILFIRIHFKTKTKTHHPHACNPSLCVYFWGVKGVREYTKKNKNKNNKIKEHTTIKQQNKSYEIFWVNHAPTNYIHKIYIKPFCVYMYVYIRNHHHHHRHARITMKMCLDIHFIQKLLLIFSDQNSL